MPELNPGGAADMNAAIKARYEANANTNAYTDAEKTKLAGIATAATANATDAQLRDRATHTGTQAASTITGTKTSSFISDFASAVAALITGKQDTLVSGTSIKTVNGTSLLGSGDVSVAGGSPNLDGYTQMAPASGLFVANSANATAFSTAAQVADRMVIAPFVAAYSMTIDQLGVSVSTLLAGANAKCVIYAADSNGRPTTLLRETPDISAAAAATVFGTITSITLTAGATYWIGVRTSGTFTLRTLGAAALPALDYTNAATPASRQTLTRTLTYATAANDWTYSSSHHSTVPMPLVLMRIA
jgi:hypothetical protein